MEPKLLFLLSRYIVHPMKACNSRSKFFCIVWYRVLYHLVWHGTIRDMMYHTVIFRLSGAKYCIVPYHTYWDVSLLHHISSCSRPVAICVPIRFPSQTSINIYQYKTIMSLKNVIEIAQLWHVIVTIR